MNQDPFHVTGAYRIYIHDYMLHICFTACQIALKYPSHKDCSPLPLFQYFVLSLGQFTWKKHNIHGFFHGFLTVQLRTPQLGPPTWTTSTPASRVSELKHSLSKCRKNHMIEPQASNKLHSVFLISKHQSHQLYSWRLHESKTSANHFRQTHVSSILKSLVVKQHGLHVANNWSTTNHEIKKTQDGHQGLRWGFHNLCGNIGASDTWWALWGCLLWHMCGLWSLRFIQ